MPYLIDGHNLIGQMPNICLHDPEDEMQLVLILNEFFKKRRISGTVFFDRRGPGLARKTGAGRLKVEFATPPNTADRMIEQRLRSIKKEASNCVVISSDREIQTVARVLGAKVMDSSEFAKQLQDSNTRFEEDEKPQSPISAKELRRWEKLFTSDKKQS